MEIHKNLRGSFNWNHWAIVVLLISLVSIYSALIPPFQSPDEFDHIKRAYLLGKGQFVLATPAGLPTGGDIDSGLLQYANVYANIPFHPEAKVSAAIIVAAKTIRWSGTREFSPAPGTGYYFPLAYAPQAVGLLAGEVLDLTVERSYRLARLMVLVSCIGALSIAFSIFPTNPLTVALLVIPMSIFQFASASLDAFTTSLSILVISIFLGIVTRTTKASTWHFLGLGIVTFTVVSCRVHLLPLLALPYLAYVSSRERKHLFLAIAVSIATFTWLLVAIKSTHDPRLSTHIPASDAVKFYLMHPASFISALANTIGDNESANFYMQSFVGILGWLDTRFSEAFYQLVIGMLLLVSVSTVSFNKRDWHQRLLLLGIAFISALLVFFALLVTWNPVPATVIQGVQGRYFLVPLILISYALAGTAPTAPMISRAVSVLTLFALTLATTWSMPNLLIHRYFIAQ